MKIWSVGGVIPPTDVFCTIFIILINRNMLIVYNYTILQKMQKIVLHFQIDRYILVTSVADVIHRNHIMVNLNKDVPNGQMRLRSIFFISKVVHPSQSQIITSGRLTHYILVSHNKKSVRRDILHQSVITWKCSGLNNSASTKLIY